MWSLFTNGLPWRCGPLSKSCLHPLHVQGLRYLFLQHFLPIIIFPFMTLYCSGRERGRPTLLWLLWVTRRDLSQVRKGVGRPYGDTNVYTATECYILSGCATYLEVFSPVASKHLLD